NLTAVPATNPRAAAEYYPAGFWFSLIRVPNKSEFATTGAGADGNAMAPHVKSQAEWLRIMKSGGCMACHQLGSKGTRVIPQALGAFPTSTAAWERRLQSGQAGGQMIGTLGQLGVERALAMFADWPARIAGGEVRQTPHPNPQPAEGTPVGEQSPYSGNECSWTSKNNVHNPMFDERGRVWITSTVRPPDNPPFCKAGSSHPSARAFPLNRAGRHLAVYDPKTGKLTHIGTCFSTHHLMFAEDANRTLWTSGGGPVVGWLNTKLFDETDDEERSQG